MNKIIITGNLVEAPEARITPNGVAVTTFRVAVNRTRDREKCDFFTVVTWRGLAENCGKYLEKGQKVGVIGEVQTRSYDAKDGTKRYVTEIIADEVEFLTRRKDQSADEAKAETSTEAAAKEGFTEIEDDELPF